MARIATFLGALLLLAALVLPAAGQQATLLDALQGKLCPLTMKVGEMTPEWKQLNLSMKSDNPMQFIMMAMTMERNGPGTELPPPVFFTKGMSLEIGGETFLVVYQVPQKPLDLRALKEGSIPDPPPPITAESTLVMALLNLRTIDTVTNIQPVDAKKIAESEAAINAIYKSAQVRAQETNSTNNLRQLAAASQMYAQDHDETFPEIKAWNTAINVDPGITRSPSSKEIYLFNPALSGKNLGEIANPTEAILAWDPKPDALGMRGVAFVDGHVTLIDEKQWKETLKQSDAALKPAAPPAPGGAPPAGRAPAPPGPGAPPPGAPGGAFH